MSSVLSELTFFLSSPQPCSYIEMLDSSVVFLTPDTQLNIQQYTHLSLIGFRRSGNMIYRPHCVNCHSCISIRVCNNTFKLSSNQRRCINKNQDLTVRTTKPHFSEEHYTLYERYIEAAHRDSSMYPATSEQFQQFLVTSPVDSRFYEYRTQQGELVAVSVTDELKNGRSLVYSFFSPDHTTRSLGTFIILNQVLRCQTQNIPYLYLGYWVPECRKMRYKSRFQPVEILQQDGQWHPLNQDTL